MSQCRENGAGCRIVNSDPLHKRQEEGNFPPCLYNVFQELVHSYTKLIDEPGIRKRSCQESDDFQEAILGDLWHPEKQ